MHDAHLARRGNLRGMVARGGSDASVAAWGSMLCRHGVRGPVDQESEAQHDVKTKRTERHPVNLVGNRLPPELKPVRPRSEFS